MGSTYKSLSRAPFLTLGERVIYWFSISDWWWGLISRLWLWKLSLALLIVIDIWSCCSCYFWSTDIYMLFLSTFWIDFTSILVSLALITFLDYNFLLSSLLLSLLLLLSFSFLFILLSFFISFFKISFLFGALYVFKILPRSTACAFYRSPSSKAFSLSNLACKRVANRFWIFLRFSYCNSSGLISLTSSSSERLWPWQWLPSDNYLLSSAISLLFLTSPSYFGVLNSNRRASALLALIISEAYSKLPSRIAKNRLNRMKSAVSLRMTKYVIEPEPDETMALYIIWFQSSPIIIWSTVMKDEWNLSKFCRGTMPFSGS